MQTPIVVDARNARRLLLQLQGLSDNPRRNMDATSLYELIEQMGYVQLDSINSVERAHHLTLHSRCLKYNRDDLDLLIGEKRQLFENWTHDSSVIPTVWYPHWNFRFARMKTSLRERSWFADRLGDEPDRTIARVLDHIHAHGATTARDLLDVTSERSEKWWGWSPSKTALEYLWHTGAIAVVKRDKFMKVYDLAERVIPACFLGLKPDRCEHIDWACTAALDRSGIATPAEIAAFWDLIALKDAQDWCRDNHARLQKVHVTPADGTRPREAFAWRTTPDRLTAVPAPPKRMRFLSPFDPVIRNRNRAMRYFGFDYRFEAFVPAHKRNYGYYTLPILESDRITGRASMKHHRDRGELIVDGLWWERGVKAGKQRMRSFETALESLRKFIGADRYVVNVLNNASAL